jgi:hypothetical protein
MLATIMQKRQKFLASLTPTTIIVSCGCDCHWSVGHIDQQLHATAGATTTPAFNSS